MRTHTSQSFFTALLILLGLFCIVPKVRAQQDPAAAKPPANSGPSQPVAGKKVQTQPQASLGSETSAGQKNAKSHDDGDILRKRAEWFYRQRASVRGRIPAGAYQSAFQHLQRMLRAEGKFAEGSTGPSAFANPLPFPAWTPIGPTPTTGGEFSPVTGRVLAIAVDPSDASGNTVLLGGAMGGIWRSTNAGASWTAVGDQNASLAMGSIAFAPSSNGSIVYAGTGEADAIGFDVYYGAGVLKSTDHGQTWTQTCTVASSTCPFIGPYSDVTPFGFFTLGGTRISYVSVNPTDPQMVLVGAETQFAEGTTEGVYCSDNGGNTWTNILPDQLSSFVGFASSTVAYAALGNPFGSSQGAPNGNGIYKATGIGSTCATIHFARLTSATLPAQSSMGRIDIGIAPSDTSGNTLYASIADSSQGSITNLGVFLSSNGGTSWTQTNAPDVCQHQCWYDNVVKVDPAQPNVAFLAGGAVTDSSGNPSWVVRSSNNGATWASIIPSLPLGSSPGLPHVDNHALAFVKLSTGKIRLYLGNDGGIWRTDDAEAASVQWTNLNNPSLTLTQFYPSISVSPSSPSFVFGGTQDNGSQNYSGSLNWMDNQQCGDGGSTAVDSLIPSTVYIGCATGFPVNVSYQNGTIGTFTPAVSGINPNDFSSFIPPIVTDPSSANTAYFGTTGVYQSVDSAVTWTPITGPLANGPGDYIAVLAVAPGNSSVVYAGGFHGGVFVATNVGAGTAANFSQASGQLTLPPRAVSAIAVDPADKTGMTAYVAFSGFSFVSTSLGVNDSTGHIFKTTNGGVNWTDVSCSVVTPANCSGPAVSDLPNIPVNDIVVDPDLPGILYAATDLGVFIGNCSTAPCTWSALGTGLPHVVVLSLRLHEPSRTLIAGTHGRGAWTIALNNFTSSGPRISSISPVSANVGGMALTLTVNGSGLTGGTIQFGGTALTPVGTGSDTSLSGTVPANLLIAGVPSITVTVASQTSNALPFAVLAVAPTISSVSPSSTPINSNDTPIVVIGTNFSTNSVVVLNPDFTPTSAQPHGQVVVPTTFQSPTKLSATIPAAFITGTGSTNSVGVRTRPPGGGTTLSPPTGPAPLPIFRVVAPPPSNDSFASAMAFNSLGGQLIVDSSAATTESTDPILPCVTQLPNGGGKNGSYNTVWFTFTPGLNGTINDLSTQFSNYDTTLAIFTGTAGHLTMVPGACNDDISPGIIQSDLQNIPVTAGTTYYIVVGSFGPPDPNPVALGGYCNVVLSYTGINPAPTITSISPSSILSGSPPFALTINGTGFVPSSQFIFDTGPNSESGGMTVFSPTQAQAPISDSAIVLPGTAKVTVINPPPGGGSSNTVNFQIALGTNPTPTAGFLNPSSAFSGGSAFSLDLFGKNFATNATLQFNGSSRATTVLDQGHLTASILASDISTVGTAQVTVTNPAPGGGVSNQLSFSIIPGPPDFTLTASGATTQTVNAGSTATYTNVLSVSPQSGFTATVNLTCSIVASATQCSVNPASLTNGSATVTVTTTARGLMPPTLRPPQLYWPVPIYLVLVSIMLIAILLAIRARRFRLAFAIPAITLALLVAFHSVGCGGGGSSGPPPPPPPQGTPAGSYTITVTATSGNLTHTTTLTLVVN